MYCSKCGVLNAESSALCYSCGNELVTGRDTSAKCDEIASPQNMEPSQSKISDAGISEVTKSSDTKNEHCKKRMSQTLHVVIAFLVCIGIYFAYAVIGVLLGWKRGGGFIPTMIMLALMGYAWRVITGSGRKRTSK